MARKSKTTKRGASTDSQSTETESTVKSRGLFDHINHIREVQDPDYYDNLSEVDRKSWSNFMVLRALSMSPKFIEYASILFQFFDIIPPPAMYRAVIGLVDKGKDWSKWVKAKPSKYPKPIVELVARHFEIPTSQAKGYVHIYLSSQEGKDTLREMAVIYGKDDKEIAKMFKGEDDYE
jgi:hypothetical protein